MVAVRWVEINRRSDNSNSSSINNITMKRLAVIERGLEKNLPSDDSTSTSLEVQSRVE
jgi:hypothetical protein